ncbi:hypothetical protein KR059_003005, partial [Drosophila kikkawai]
TKSRKLARSPQLHKTQGGQSSDSTPPPKRSRDPASPAGSPRTTPAKKCKASVKAACQQDLQEMGKLLHEVSLKMMDKTTRHISMSLREMIAKVKSLHSNILVANRTAAAGVSDRQESRVANNLCRKCAQITQSADKEQQTATAWKKEASVQTEPGTAGALSRMLPNTRGPRQYTRKLLSSVVTAQILYAAPVWAEAASVKSYMRGVEATYRVCAIRIACSFRTISEDAALVIAGQVPLAKLIRERKEIFAAMQDRRALPSRAELKVAARRRSIENWQSQWDSSSKGRWTYRLIPDIARWVERSHGQVNFYLSQVLSGHGCFRH